MDIFTPPQICTTVAKDFSPRLRSLAQMAEILELAYGLIDHPILGDWKGFDHHDIFLEASKNPPFHAVFNRTLIERTIYEASFYSDTRFEGDLFLSFSSEGYERALGTLDTFMFIAKKIYEYSDEEIREYYTNILFFRLTQGGAISGLLKYLLNCCLGGLLVIKKKSVLFKLKQIATHREKKLFLLRTKADLLQAQKEMPIFHFEALTAVIHIEIDFLENSSACDADNDSLRSLINTFLAQQRAKIDSASLLHQLVNGHLDDFARQLQELILQVFSYHDISGKEPEKVYHAFLIGLLHQLVPEYSVRSNRESGLGRFDIALIPSVNTKNGIIIEVKKGHTTNQAVIHETLHQAMLQIQKNNYFIELKLAGVQQYNAVSIVFVGKQLFLHHQLFLIH